MRGEADLNQVGAMKRFTIKTVKAFREGPVDARLNRLDFGNHQRRPFEQVLHIGHAAGQFRGWQAL
jgi:hypothetical protein